MGKAYEISVWKPHVGKYEEFMKGWKEVADIFQRAGVGEILVLDGVAGKDVGNIVIIQTFKSLADNGAVNDAIGANAEMKAWREKNKDKDVAALISHDLYAAAEQIKYSLRVPGLLKITFTAEVIYWRGPAPFYYLKVPLKFVPEMKKIAPKITFGWGMLPADCESQGVEFYTALFPKDGTYYLPLRKDLREKLKIELGDRVKVTANF